MQWWQKRQSRCGRLVQLITAEGLDCRAPVQVNGSWSGRCWEPITRAAGVRGEKQRWAWVGRASRAGVRVGRDGEDELSMVLQSPGTCQADLGHWS